jgi:SAM-dependent methyltransferase
MIDAVLKQDRRLRISHHEILKRASPAGRDLIGLIDRYLDDYCRLRGLSAEAFLREYTAFIARYTDDMKRFKETGRYPLELPDRPPPPSRPAYDAALLLSVLVSAHRFRIFEALLEVTPPLGRTVIIGAGPGLELHLLAGRAAAIDVFDLTIEETMVRQHPGVRFHQEAFSGAGRRYDTVLAIELLEHVREPYLLLGECYHALETGGRLVATTATNIPQFDHEFNFVDDGDFEGRAREIGFTVARREAIVHDATFLDIGARNTFYVLARPDAAQGRDPGSSSAGGT